MNDQSKSEFLLAAGLVVIGIATRLLFNALHVYNFNAVIASAIFAGAYLSRSKYGLLVPMITMFATDAIFKFYDLPFMAVVYGSFILAYFIGTGYSKKPSLLRYIGVTLGGSLVFFIVTNFAWWPFYTTLYPHTIGGLIQSYTMALPFYRNSLLSDLLFTSVLFGGFEMAKVFLPRVKKEVVLN
ncbi:MAG: hypothetical protein Q8916_12370 [Bacteroidota bacterium]|nr:hypothetical protein [Bacteroidota bacterium]